MGDNKKITLNFIGVFLILMGVLRVSEILFFGVSPHVFWLCNHIPIFLGIAILLRNSFLLIGEFSFLFVGQLIWIIGFILYALFGIIVPGNSAYLIYERSFVNILSIIVHFLTLPLAFWAIMAINKRQKYAWVVGLAHSLILLPVVIYFGKDYNLNCFYEPCVSLINGSLFYSLLIIPAYILLFVIPINYLVNRILKRSKRSS